MALFSLFYRPLNFKRSPEYPLKELFRYLDDEVKRGYMTLDPDFQRAHVWTQEQQEAFMGHWISGGVVSPIIFSVIGDEGTGVALLVDGKQRLKAIRRWLDYEITARLVDGTSIKRIDVLDYERMERRLSLTLGFLHLSNDRYTALKETMELYVRLNTGGTPHSFEEIERVRRLIGDMDGITPEPEAVVALALFHAAKGDTHMLQKLQKELSPEK